MFLLIIATNQVFRHIIIRNIHVYDIDWFRLLTTRFSRKN